MASVQCVKCKEGIHYHGEPEGIEYIFIKEKDWDKITSSCFDPLNKQYVDKSSAPILFQTDTIESDFAELIIKVWKCPECGSIMFFDRFGKVIETYEKDGEDGEELESDNNYVVFDDYAWEILTECAIPNRKITKQFHPTIYARRTDLRLMFTMNDGEVLEKYKRFEMPLG